MVSANVVFFFVVSFFLPNLTILLACSSTRTRDVAAGRWQANDPLGIFRHRGEPLVRASERIARQEKQTVEQVGG